MVTLLAMVSAQDAVTGAIKGLTDKLGAPGKREANDHPGRKREANDHTGR